METLADRLRATAAEIDRIVRLCSASSGKLRGLGHGLIERGMDAPGKLADYEGTRLDKRAGELRDAAAAIVAAAMRIETIRTVLINRADAEDTRPILMNPRGFGGETGGERCEGRVPGHHG